MVNITNICKVHEGMSSFIVLYMLHIAIDITMVMLQAHNYKHLHCMHAGLLESASEYRMYVRLSSYSYHASFI